MSFDQFGLSAELLRSVTRQGYWKPTPIQQQAIPLILSGQDIPASAQTGTGKQVACGFPLLQRLQSKHKGAQSSRQWSGVRLAAAERRARTSRSRGHEAPLWSGSGQPSISGETSQSLELGETGREI
jgi:hypothetical protein